MLLVLKNLFSAALILALCLCACGKEQPQNVQPQNEALPVATLIVEAKDVPVSFEYVAQTQSSHLVNIQARVTGFLEKRVYKEGADGEERGRPFPHG